MAGIVVMSIFVLGKVGFNPIELFNARRGEHDGRGSTFSLGPGTFLDDADRHRLARPRAGARHRRACRTS